MQYKIQLRYSNCWDDAGWSDETDGEIKPTRFGAVGDAQVALYEFFADIKTAVAAGDMASEANSADYRIVAMDG
jgi:hypothetical protein